MMFDKASGGKDTQRTVIFAQYDASKVPLKGTWAEVKYQVEKQGGRLPSPDEARQFCLAVKHGKAYAVCP